MLNMSQVNDIKDLAREGKRIGEISKKLKVDPKTIRKYLNKTDFSPTATAPKKKGSVLDPYKETIDSWLESDLNRWHKQRHTAQRVHNRLQEQYPDYTCSYPTVARYVRTKNIELQKTKHFQELVWHPGEAQVDFGEADFEEKSDIVRNKYLTVSFPHSNDSLTQVFGGETAECVCQGLKDIFNYIGGVPSLLIFDNATGVGRRVGEQIREAKLFASFRAHYDFSIKFCNPNSGHEKGHVENKINYTRHNLFVPPLAYDDIEQFNRELLDKHKQKAKERHYKKQVSIHELFEEDRKALRPLPTANFDVCRYETVRADGYGKICIDDRHHYSTCPEYGKSQVLVGIRAHVIDVLTPGYELLVRHTRRYGMKRTDNLDFTTSLSVLMRNVGAWPNSGVRETMPPFLRDVLDEQPRDELRQSIRTLQQLSSSYSYEIAIEAMQEGLRLNRNHFCDAAALAARIHGFGLMTPPERGPDLKIYDSLLQEIEA